LEALELAMEKALRMNTNMATMVPLELECTVPSGARWYGAHNKTPKLVSGLALALPRKHRAENHPPPASSLYTPLNEIVKLPVVLSTTTITQSGTRSMVTGQQVLQTRGGNCQLLRGGKKYSEEAECALRRKIVLREGISKARDHAQQQEAGRQ
jgi:hypothetical protein